MGWQNQIPGCFGEADCYFASHPLDEQRAKAAIKAAKAAGATFADFEKEVVWHCYREMTDPGYFHDHLADQVAKAKKLWGAK